LQICGRNRAPEGSRRVSRRGTDRATAGGQNHCPERSFGDRYGYVSLETPDLRAAALTDPRGFLAAHSPPVIFDEVQYAPELLPYIKERSMRLGTALASTC
jgi:hypothetical protein